MTGKSTNTAMERPKYHTTPDGTIVVDIESFFEMEEVREQVKLILELDKEEKDRKRRALEAGADE